MDIMSSVVFWETTEAFCAPKAGVDSSALYWARNLEATLASSSESC